MQLKKKYKTETSVDGIFIASSEDSVTFQRRIGIFLLILLTQSCVRNFQCFLWEPPTNSIAARCNFNREPGWYITLNSLSGETKCERETQREMKERKTALFTKWMQRLVLCWCHASNSTTVNTHCMCALCSYRTLFAYVRVSFHFISIRFVTFNATARLPYII